MKKLYLVFLFFLGVLSYAQKDKIGQNKIDQKLVGTWKGSETDQQIKGMSKYWVLTRFADGTFSIMFNMVKDCTINSSVETGQWWVENGKYYELHFYSGNTDVYSYTFPTENTVKYKMVDSAYMENSYEFIDTKVYANGEKE